MWGDRLVTLSKGGVEAWTQATDRSIGNLMLGQSFRGLPSESAGT